MRFCNLQKLFYIAAVLLLPLFFIACQSAPAIPDAVAGEADYIPLEPGASAYVLVDVVNALPILHNMSFIDMNNRQMRQILDKTKSAAAAFYPGNPLRYRLAAWGAYPASAARMALGASLGWKRYRSSVSGERYWYSAGESLALSINSAQALVAGVRNAPPAQPLLLEPDSLDPFSTQAAVVPETFNEFRRGSVLACWFEQSGQVLSQRLGALGLPPDIQIPAESLFMSIVPADGTQYHARVQMSFASPAQAGAITMLLTMAKGFLPEETGPDGFLNMAALLLAGTPEQAGNNLVITTGNMSGRDVALLFNMFSL